MRRRCIAILYLVQISTQAASLPDPLTLDYVMSLPLTETPEIEYANSEVNLRLAKRQLTLSESDFTASFQARFGYIEPSAQTTSQSKYDNRYSITLNQPLYDFGRSKYANESSEHALASSRQNYQRTLGQYRIEVMHRYFAILLADLAYIRDNEAMSSAYVRFDRVKKKNKLGQVSEIEVLEKENTYHVARQKYYESIAAQKLSRTHLASILNMPNQLAVNVAAPKFMPSKQAIPDIDDVRQQAINTNPKILTIKQQLKSAKAAVDSSRSYRWPRVSAEAQAFEYTRKLNNQNDWQVNLIVDVPIWNGDKVSARVAKKQVAVFQAQALLRQQELYIYSHSLTLIQQLEMLNIQRQRNEKKMEYQDLYLDRSRALYEMEVKSDLGDSMTKISAAKYNLAETEYKRQLVWAQLNAFLGKPIYHLHGNDNHEKN